MSTPIEEIKSRLDLVEFIQSYTRLQKAGINYRANCPFHTEKTPSFFVSPARQIWHCFGGCQKGGDIFKFAMEIEGLDFPEALRLLAGRAGVVLKREDPTIRSERNRLYDLCEEATKIFEKNIELTASAKNYLLKRGLKHETIKEFRLGFAPQSWDFLLKTLAGQGFRKEEIEKAGLVVKSEDRSSWYDRFRSRIIFPIADTNARIIGFGGRIFESEIRNQESGKTEAKYINTPQTLIYDKSRALYGFDKAKQDIRTQNRVVLVEGYMDCVMSHQAGVKNTVAVSGTALTPYQLQILRRLCEVVVSSFDTDEAGESATKRSLNLAAQFEFDRRIASITSGKDPADTVALSPGLWIDAVATARPVVEFYFDKVFRTNSKETAEGKKKISADLLPWISELKNEIEKSHWVGELAKHLSVSEESVWAELRKKNRPQVAHPNIKEDIQKSFQTRREILEERLLSLLSSLHHDTSPMDQGVYVVFSSSLNQEAFRVLSTNLSTTNLQNELLRRIEMLRFQGEVMAQTLKDPREELRICVREFEKECIKDKLQKLGHEISSKEKSGNQAEVNSLLDDFRCMSGRLKKLS